MPRRYNRSNLPTERLDPKRALDNPEEFVEFWSGEYQYPNQRLYDENIGQSLTAERVWKLFAWKNGTGETIAPKKRRSIEKNYIAELGRVPTLSCIDDGRSYLISLQGGAIWGIFWLHLINHKLFPIFDQNTYRSMAAMMAYEAREIPHDNPSKINAYFTQYIPFLRKFNAIDERSLDKALFAFGQVLKPHRPSV
jgi:hypothetical protein